MPDLQTEVERLRADLADCRTRAAAAERDALNIRNALAELVRLKDLKDWLHDNNKPRIGQIGTYARKHEEYERCKPIAWDAARAALRERREG